MGRGRQTLTTDEFARRAQEKHGERFDYSNTVYGGSKKPLKLICRKHGRFQIPQAAAHLRFEHGGCPGCKDEAATYCSDVWSQDLLDRWHPKLNGNRTPQNTTAGSAFKATLYCIRKHYPPGDRPVCEKPKAVYSTLKHPACARCQSLFSKMQCRVFCELRTMFPDAEFGSQIDGIECDILIPDEAIVIEVDGGYWHEGFEERDKRKNKKLSEYGMTVFRLRGEGLQPISEWDICHKKHDDHLLIIKRLLRSILANLQLPGDRADAINAYLHRSKFADEQKYRELANRLPAPPYEKSLAGTHQEIADEWHYELNYPVRPEDVTHGEQEPRYWHCPIERHPPYLATCNDRTSRGNGCPVCANRITLFEESFGYLHPDMVQYWSPKNKKSAYELKPTYAPAIIWCDSEGRESRQTMQSFLKNGLSYSGSGSVGVLYPELIPFWHEDNEMSVYEVPAGGSIDGKKVKAKFYKPNGQVHEAWVHNKVVTIKRQREGRRSRYGPDSKVLGDRLRELQDQWLRDHPEKYGQDIFQALGISRSDWYNYLKGKGIRMAQLKRIADFFGVDPSFLIGQ